MFEVSVEARFSAAHHLVGYPGSCAGVHGHNWQVQVFLAGDDLDETGILVDFRTLRGAVADAISEMDHRDLNTLEAFGSGNPTSENLARYLFGQLSAALNTERVRIDRVSVSETPQSTATYRE